LLSETIRRTLFDEKRIREGGENIFGFKYFVDELF